MCFTTKISKAATAARPITSSWRTCRRWPIRFWSESCSRSDGIDFSRAKHAKDAKVRDERRGGRPPLRVCFWIIQRVDVELSQLRHNLLREETERIQCLLLSQFAEG